MGCEEESLPSDIIFEILSRCSLESVDECKAVCRSWKHIIYEATFLPLHTKRSGCVFGYFFQDTTNFGYRSAFVSEGGAGNIWWCDERMRILGSSDEGILCCERQIRCYIRRYYACKPATNQYQALPNPKLRYRTASVAIVVCKSRPLRYIIVRLSENKIMEYINCEIFDSESWRWEKTQTPLILGSGDFINPHNPAVSVGQSVYWLTNKDDVVAFDIYKRRFRRFPLPGSVLCSVACTQKRLVKYVGELGFILSNEERSSMELWVAARPQPQLEWTLKMVVDMSFRPLEFCNSDVVFASIGGDGGVFYDVQSCRFTRVDVPYHFRHAREVFRFRSDLEIVNLHGSRSS